MANITGRSYSEILDWMFSQLPMYQRSGAAAYKADLSTTHRLMELANHPEKNLKVLHVAGTNGKGSVSHLCASVLQESGYKVGLYTSPHLKDFRERIKVNGEMIPEAMIMEFIGHYQENFEELKPSFFEMTVLLAFEYFNYSKVDIAVVEVGMGGRLDSTNVVSPDVSVITNIGLDHQKFLGETHELIAREKAGIVKDGVPVICGHIHEEALSEIKAIAEAKKAPLHQTEKANFEAPLSALKGAYQRQNERTAWLALYHLRQRGWEIQPEHVSQGFERVIENTGLRGRWEVLADSPKTIVDAGHNLDGVQAILSSLEKETFDDLHIVWGVSNDKDLEPILSLLPKHATYYFCRANIARAKDADELLALAQEHGLKGEAFKSVGAAYQAARLYAKASDIIFIGGSVFVVAEVI